MAPLEAQQRPSDMSFLQLFTDWISLPWTSTWPGHSWALLLIPQELSSLITLHYRASGLLGVGSSCFELDFGTKTAAFLDLGFCPGSNEISRCSLAVFGDSMFLLPRVAFICGRCTGFCLFSIVLTFDFSSVSFFPLSLPVWTTLGRGTGVVYLMFAFCHFLPLTVGRDCFDKAMLMNYM